MKVDIKQLPNSEIEMFIELDPKEWGDFIDEAAKELSREVKINGFRPGQAPRNLVEQKIGSGKILEKAADAAVKKTYVKIILENKIEAIGRPEIQVLKIAPDNPFEFKVKATVMPEVKLGDYQKIAQGEKKKIKEEIIVSDQELNDSLNYLQKSRAKFSTVVRPAQKGDRVEIDFSAKIDGQAIAGGENRNFPLVLGEGHFAPGFEDNLLGMKENEDKKFQLLFPEDYLVKELAGRLVDFEVKMKLIQESELPELNDDFARAIGRFENLLALKDSVKKGLLAEKESREKEVWRAKVLEKIIAKSAMEIPQILIDAELEKMSEELKNSLAQMGLDFELYLKDIKKSEEELKRGWPKKAEERAAAALVLRTIGDKEKIEVAAKELEEEINKILAHYSSLGSPEKQIDLERLKEYTNGRLKNEKVFQLLESY